MHLLKEMAVFAHVVDHGGFTLAARALGVEPSSVSRSVARLERALGVRLLARSPRAITLTEVGALTYAECARIVAASAEVQALAERHGVAPAGTLRLSAPVSLGQLWLAPLVVGFTRRHPDVDLRITLDDAALDLTASQIDIALRICTEPPAAAAARQLFAVPYVLIAAPGYLASHGTPDHPALLSGHRCLHLGYGAFTPVWPLRRGAEEVDVAVSPRLALGNSLGICTAAEQGGGIGLVPAFAAHAALAAGRLVRVLPDWELGGTYRRAAWLVFAAGPNLPPKIRVFVDYLLGCAAPPGAGH